MQNKIAAIMVQHLIADNGEYRKLHATIGDKALPVVRLVPFGKLRTSAHQTTLLNIKGKKPRLVLQST